MAKVRVFEAAKEHELDVQELLGVLKKNGVKVRSHMSPVDQEDLDRAVEVLGKKVAEDKKTTDASEPKLMVRRRKKDQPAVDEEAEVATAEGVGEGEEEPAKAAEATPEAEAEPQQEAAKEAPEEAGKEAGEEEPAAEAAAGEAKKKVTKKAGKKAGKKAKDEAAEEKPAEEKPAEEDKEFGLKVVRFIRPEDQPKTFTPPAYPMTKNEREARRAERKAKKKKGRRVERVDRQQRSSQKTQITVPKAIKRRIKISDVITVAELAKRMGVKSTEVIKALMALGILATINQLLDADTASLVADEFSYEVENVAMNEEEILNREEDKLEDMQPRPPVITVMGHVDHGKTSLLDAIRETRVAAGEAGGITQHIGAYKVSTSRGTLVFLDTPGHEAFTEMRARGAKVTDMVVLVVAANDGVMPQTVEAIHHAEAAGVPIIVAINKMDLPDASPDRVKRELSENNLAPEDWGGEVVCVPVSAKKGDGIEDLLEMVALQAEMLELTANPDKMAAGVVVEARLDRGRGPVATVLVHEGTLKLGDVVLSGMKYGRVRTLTDDIGKREKEATPGTPVEITGLDGVPKAGDVFVVVDNERVAKDISSKRVDKTRETEMAQASRMSLDDLHERIAEGDIKSLRIIVKGDVQGSVEALAQTLIKLATDAVKVEVIHKAAGGITESDVNLAIASEAIIVGFHVRAEAKAAALANNTGIDVRLYDVIYDATDDVKKAMAGLLAPTIKEVELGRVEVRQIFRVTKIGVIAGCYVTQGIVQRNAHLRLVRDSIVVYEGLLSSLKRFKDDAKEVREGFECGLSIQDFNDIKVGDEIEFFRIEEVAATL